MSYFGLLKGKISDTEVRDCRVDKSTGTLQVINYEHHEIHSGSHYEVRINKDMPNGGTYNIAFTTPDTAKWVHIIFGISVELQADIILYEGITSFTGGTAVTPMNNNRNSVNTSGVTDMEFDTTPTLGTPLTLAHMVLGSGRAVGGEARSQSEFVLKQNTTYLVAIVNQSGSAANETNIFLNWYEHEDKD